MNAPDKIFVPTRFTLVDGLRVRESDTDEEYIRKDALMEWAKRLKEKWEEPPVSKYSPGCLFMLEQVIRKIESL